MIRSFRDKDTERLFLRERRTRFAKPLQRAALRKLLLIDAAESLDDLRVPPGNRLEKLKGDRAGQYSIRINEQWRICFRWENGEAVAIEIADYH
jgi:toxin HigB-1